MATPSGFVPRVARLIYGIDHAFEWLPPLAARLVVGPIFLRTGYGKLTSFHHIVLFFQTLHLPAPTFNAALASGSELVCGALLLVGLFTRLAPIPLVITMIVALKTAVIPALHPHGLGGWIGLLTHEEVHYIVLFLWLAIAGAGPLSLDQLLKKRAGLPPRR